MEKQNPEKFTLHGRILHFLMTVIDFLKQFAHPGRNNSDKQPWSLVVKEEDSLWATFFLCIRSLANLKAKITELLAATVIPVSLFAVGLGEPEK